MNKICCCAEPELPDINVKVTCACCESHIQDATDLDISEGQPQKVNEEKEEDVVCCCFRRKRHAKSKNKKTSFSQDGTRA